MRVYLYEEYAGDDWIVNALKGHKKSLMSKHNLKSLSFSYSLPSNGPEVIIKEESDVANAIKESIIKIISI